MWVDIRLFLHVNAGKSRHTKFLEGREFNSLVAHSKYGGEFAIQVEPKCTEHCGIHTLES